jgi:CHASE3 domain sensor protein
MIDNSHMPFYRSYLLGGKTVYLDELKTLTDSDLSLLQIESQASYDEAKQDYGTIEDKASAKCGSVYRRMKVASYFKAAIGLELKNRSSRDE